MIDFFYIWAFVSIGILTLGFLIKDYPISMFGAISFIALGVYSLGYGFPNLKNWLTDLTGIVLIGLNIYIFIRGSLEQFKNY
jgi:hypothetical protein